MSHFSLNKAISYNFMKSDISVPNSVAVNFSESSCSMIQISGVVRYAQYLQEHLYFCKYIATQTIPTKCMLSKLMLACILVTIMYFNHLYPSYLSNSRFFWNITERSYTHTTIPLPIKSFFSPCCYIFSH